MRFASVFVAAIVLSGCALRLRYLDLVKPDATGADARFVLLDADSNQPLPGVKFEMSEWKNVVRGTTAADGSFSLPVAKKYADENPVLAVTLPAGVKRYRVEPPKPAPPVAPVAPPPAEPAALVREAPPAAPEAPAAPAAPAVNNEPPAPSQR